MGGSARKLLTNVSDAERSPIVRLNRLWLNLKSRLVNLQSRRGSLAIAKTHYDLDHRLYERFLGPYNQYTCCFFHRAGTLAAAEVEKLDSGDSIPIS